MSVGASEVGQRDKSETTGQRRGLRNGRQDSQGRGPRCQLGSKIEKRPAWLFHAAPAANRPAAGLPCRSPASRAMPIAISSHGPGASRHVFLPSRHPDAPLHRCWLGDMHSQRPTTPPPASLPCHPDPSTGTGTGNFHAFPSPSPPTRLPSKRRRHCARAGGLARPIAPPAVCTHCQTVRTVDSGRGFDALMLRVHARRDLC